MVGGDVRNDSGILKRRKDLHKPSFADDIVCIQSPMIYTDTVAYNFVGDAKGLWFGCFLFLSSKLKSGDIITTGQYVNYEIFSNLQSRRLLKNSFHSININLRDTSGENILFVSVGLTRPNLIFRKVSDIHL